LDVLKQAAPRRASADRNRFVLKQREAVSRTFGKASFDDQVKSILTRTFYGLPAR
jgi:hypothetical protein